MPYVLPPYCPDFARPLSQSAEFWNVPFADERAAIAPAAMFVVISVLPFSMTSGVLLPAIVASNFCRWSDQFWYWTSTVQPGFACWNCWFAAVTTTGQPDCASTWSQTVNLLAATRCPPACAVAATTPSTTAMASIAITRVLIRTLLEPSAQSLVARGFTAPNGLYQLATGGLSHRQVVMSSPTGERDVTTLAGGLARSRAGTGRPGRRTGRSRRCG